MNGLGQNLRAIHSSSTRIVDIRIDVAMVEEKFNASIDRGDLQALLELGADMRRISSSPEAVVLVVNWLHSLWDVYKKNSSERKDIFCDVCDAMQLSADQPLLERLSTSQFHGISELLWVVKEHSTGVQRDDMRNLLARFCGKSESEWSNDEWLNDELSDDNIPILSSEGSSALRKMSEAVDGSDPMTVIGIARNVVASDMEVNEKLSVLEGMRRFYVAGAKAANQLVATEFDKLKSTVTNLVPTSNHGSEVGPVVSGVRVLNEFENLKGRMNSALSRNHLQVLDVAREIANSNLEFEEKYDILYAFGVGVLDPEVELRNDPVHLAIFEEFRNGWINNV
jgi:hypothetical protein